jgi:hypothetical protein
MVIKNFQSTKVLQCQQCLITFFKVCSRQRERSVISFNINKILEQNLFEQNLLEQNVLEQNLLEQNLLE